MKLLYNFFFFKGKNSLEQTLIIFLKKKQQNSLFLTKCPARKGQTAFKSNGSNQPTWAYA